MFSFGGTEQFEALVGARFEDELVRNSMPRDDKLPGWRMRLKAAGFVYFSWTRGSPDREAALVLVEPEQRRRAGGWWP